MLSLCLNLFFKFYFIFKLYIIVLVLPNIKMNPPQVYMCCVWILKIDFFWEFGNTTAITSESPIAFLVTDPWKRAFFTTLSSSQKSCLFQSNLGQLRALGNMSIKSCIVKWKLLSHVRLFTTPWTIWPMEFSRPKYWSW